MSVEQDRLSAEEIAEVVRQVLAESALTMSARGALDTEDAAIYTGIAALTLKKWRSTGGGPAYVRAGSRVVYRVEDLDKWLRKHRVA